MKNKNMIAIILISLGTILIIVGGLMFSGIVDTNTKNLYFPSNKSNISVFDTVDKLGIIKEFSPDDLDKMFDSKLEMSMDSQPPDTILKSSINDGVFKNIELRNKASSGMPGTPLLGQFLILNINDNFKISLEEIKKYYSVGVEDASRVTAQSVNNEKSGIVHKTYLIEKPHHQVNFIFDHDTKNLVSITFDPFTINLPNMEEKPKEQAISVPEKKVVEKNVAESLSERYNLSVYADGGVGLEVLVNGKPQEIFKKNSTEKTTINGLLYAVPGVDNVEIKFISHKTGEQDFTYSYELRGYPRDTDPTEVLFNQTNSSMLCIGPHGILDAWSTYERGIMSLYSSTISSVQRSFEKKSFPRG